MTYGVVTWGLSETDGFVGSAAHVKEGGKVGNGSNVRGDSGPDVKWNPVGRNESSTGLGRRTDMAWRGGRSERLVR